MAKLNRWMLCAVLTCAAVEAQAQTPEKRDVVAWAPTWEVGQWWEVTVFQKDLRDRLRSPAPTKGGHTGEPMTPDNPTAAPIPNFPPLRNGIPRGYKPGNRFRLEIKRKERVEYDDGPALDTKPEEFWVVHVTTLEGPKREFELWYACHDHVLSKLLIKHAKRKDREVWLNGSVQLDLPLNRELGFPLDWPDLRSAKKSKVVLRVTDRPTVEQRVRPDQKDKLDAFRVRLVEVSNKKKKVKKAPARAVFLFKQGEPTWNRMQSGLFFARLDKHGKK